MHVHEAPRIEITLTRQECSGVEGDITLTCAMKTLTGDEVADRGEAKIVLVRDGLGTAGGAHSSRPASESPTNNNAPKRGD
jgi:hypothetical protein